MLHLGADCLQPAGFAEDEALIPYPLNCFRGYRHLQEFFAFQDKFLCVELRGLEAIGRLPPELLRQAIYPETGPAEESGNAADGAAVVVPPGRWAGRESNPQPPG